MNKYFINGKFSFNSGIEIVNKRKEAQKYIADAHWAFIDSLSEHIGDLANEVYDMRNGTVSSKEYLKRLAKINKTIEYYNEVMKRSSISHGK